MLRVLRYAEARDAGVRRRLGLKGGVMKKVLIILGVVFGVFLLLVVGLTTLIFRFTSGMPDAAERFFAAVRSNNMTAAEAELSEGFKASTNSGTLRQFLESNSLTDVVDAEWNSRNISGSKGEMSGTVTTSDGGRIPLTMKFVEENEAWKIFSINKPKAGLHSGEKAQLAMPSLEQRTALVKRGMHDFALALEAKSMAPFYQSVSTLWQKQTSVEELDRVFAGFYEQDISLLALDAMLPQFDGEAQIDDDGVLVMQGRYDTDPSKVYFTQRYIQEGSDWKLIGINVNVK